MTEFGEGGIRTLGWRGTTLVGTSSTGGMWHYDTRTGVGRLLGHTLTGRPVTIRSMAEGPDGRLYAGGFLTGGLAAYQPGSGATQFWPNVGQSEGMASHQGKLYLGVHPGGRVYEFDGSGKLWGLTPDTLFEMDPATGQTLRTVKHQPYLWETQTQVWHDTNLVFHVGISVGQDAEQGVPDRPGDDAVDADRPAGLEPGEGPRRQHVHVAQREFLHLSGLLTRAGRSGTERGGRHRLRGGVPDDRVHR
ncbi:hypothetical protein [Streptomyces sp. NPDC048057]|uniref:hypothetical protein n=1 Tax=Streptomyces sp. NPDC048057 TaxID=3155628 RepID=UPI0033C09E07